MINTSSQPHPKIIQHEGQFFCLEENGTLTVLGKNDDGQLGVGHTADVLFPTEVKIPHEEISELYISSFDLEYSMRATTTFIFTKNNQIMVCGYGYSATPEYLEKYMAKDIQRYYPHIGLAQHAVPYQEYINKPPLLSKDANGKLALFDFLIFTTYRESDYFQSPCGIRRLVQIPRDDSDIINMKLHNKTWHITTRNGTYLCSYDEKHELIFIPTNPQPATGFYPSSGAEVTKHTDATADKKAKLQQ